MKKQKTITVSVEKLDETYKYVSRGGKYKKGSVCQMIRNLNDGNGAFMGLSNTSDNGTAIALTDIDELINFEITNKDGKLVDIKETT